MEVDFVLSPLRIESLHRVPHQDLLVYTHTHICVYTHTFVSASFWFNASLIRSSWPIPSVCILRGGSCEYPRVEIVGGVGGGGCLEQWVPHWRRCYLSTAQQQGGSIMRGQFWEQTSCWPSTHTGLSKQTHGPIWSQSSKFTLRTSVINPMDWNGMFTTNACNIASCSPRLPSVPTWLSDSCQKQSTIALSHLHLNSSKTLGQGSSLPE